METLAEGDRPPDNGKSGDSPLERGDSPLEKWGQSLGEKGDSPWERGKEKVGTAPEDRLGTVPLWVLGLSICDNLVGKNDRREGLSPYRRREGLSPYRSKGESAWRLM